MAIRRAFVQQYLLARLYAPAALATVALVVPTFCQAVNKPTMPANCDQAAFQQTLMPAPAVSKTDARAVWLDSTKLRWPKLDANGKFKLYYSAGGQISVGKNKRISGSDHALSLDVLTDELPADSKTRFQYVPAGVELAVKTEDLDRLKSIHKQQVLLVKEDKNGLVLDATAAQTAGALDELYQPAEVEKDFGVSLSKSNTQFKLWAPTAQAVHLCVYDSPTSKTSSIHEMQWNPITGAWTFSDTKSLDGKYYRYLVDVFVRNHGLMRNAVTDPYSISLNTDSARSYIAELDNERLKPADWEETPRPAKVMHQTDMVIYELHVRDFSINDDSVSKPNRGKYLAFTERQSRGMRHLAALSAAGMTDVHLLPVFDIATIPEQDCVSPIVTGASDSDQQQAITTQSAAKDCFNWGYDPLHFSAPEGSYASTAADGAVRIREFRSMVLALHKIGLRVGMDVVYNHTSSSGQQEKTVLDRIVPGYYQRLNALGEVERSTCCDNTATENRMMAKLMLDSTELWTKHYKIDSFRFDLMGHQPRAVMETLQKRLNAVAGHTINLIGEGWNFGEVANGARFVQASQLSLNGSGIGTFSDRGRDAIRGGNAGDGGNALVENQGYINGLGYDPNAANIGTKSQSKLLATADMVRVGLAGSIRDYAMQDKTGVTKTLEQISYGDQPAGYVSQPAEVVNYVDNHDNQTLFDINVYKLPLTTSADDRARVQMLGMAINAFSQGVAYFHAGIETLRSKSMDGNSYDSGDWFNRLDWNFHDNYFASGLPPKRDNGNNYALIKPRLNNNTIKPSRAQIVFTRDAFMDLLKIRSSSRLFRLPTSSAIKQSLRFYNTGPQQNPMVLVGHISGGIEQQRGPDAQFAELMYFINVDKKSQTITVPEQSDKAYRLHPVHLNPDAADKRPAQLAKYRTKDGSFSIPARSAVVFVIKDE